MIGCHSEQEFSSNIPDASEIPNQEGWNATLVKTQNGKLASRISYGYMQGYSNKNLVEFSEQVKVEFFDEEEKRLSTVYSDKAVLNERNNQITLKGNVRVYSEDGVRLFSEILRWDEVAAKITTDEPVVFINAENDTIYGEGFESEKSLENWVIEKPTGSSERKLKLELMEPGQKR